MHRAFDAWFPKIRLLEVANLNKTNLKLVFASTIQQERRLRPGEYSAHAAEQKQQR
jgi:hypothetical protein